jgi:hypothetical protein
LAYYKTSLSIDSWQFLGVLYHILNWLFASRLRESLSVASIRLSK